MQGLAPLVARPMSTYTTSKEEKFQPSWNFTKFNPYLVIYGNCLKGMKKRKKKKKKKLHSMRKNMAGNTYSLTLTIEVMQPLQCAIFYAHKYNFYSFSKRVTSILRTRFVLRSIAKNWHFCFVILRTLITSSVIFSVSTFPNKK